MVPTNAFPTSSLPSKPTEESNVNREKDKTSEKWDAKGVVAKGSAPRVGAAVEPAQIQLELDVGTPLEGAGGVGGGGVVHTMTNGNTNYSSTNNGNGTTTGMDIETQVASRK